MRLLILGLMVFWAGSAAAWDFGRKDRQRNCDQIVDLEERTNCIIAQNTRGGGLPPAKNANTYDGERFPSTIFGGR